MHAVAMRTPPPDEAPQAAAPETLDALAAVREAFQLKLSSALDKHLAPASAPKVGRNDPCPCGSGKKHKKCCLGNP
jgi:uncharacterized protein YecA (UPF0149 family)